MPPISIFKRVQRELFHKANRGIFLLGSALAILLLAIWGPRAKTQNPPEPSVPDGVPRAKAPPPLKADPPANAVSKKNAMSDEDKIPEPEDLSLTTSDGVRLGLTYYASNQGRETIPVVLLHASGGNRTDYQDLATLLQKQGFAVVVPDLRGHGESKKQKVGGADYTLNAAKLPIDQYKLMVEKDMYAVKEFLWERNNAKELNLNKLCVLGAEMGASVAMNFTAFDAQGYGDSDRGPYYGPLQLGLFVKALVLLSPEVSCKGLPLAPLNEDLRKNLPVLILVGKEDPKSSGEAERVAKIFKRIQPKKPEDQTDFFKSLKTKLQGVKLLEPKTLETADKLILPFLKLRLKDADQVKDWNWKKLKKPHENG